MPSYEFAANSAEKNENFKPRWLRHGFLRMRGSLLRIHAEMPVLLRSARTYVNPLSFDSIRVCWHALDHSCRSTEEANDLVGDMGRGRSHVDRQRILARIRFFECIDLAL